QTNHGAGLRAFQLNVVLRNHGDFVHGGRDSGFLDGFEHRFVVVRVGRDLPVFAIIAEVFAAIFQDDVHQVIFLNGRFGNHDVALFVEHPGNSAGFSHVAAIIGKHVAYLANGAVAIIGGDVHQQRHSAGAIGLEDGFFVANARQLAGAALDGALD